jgi:RNA polymerase sigma-70 factor, ECF subfamily
MDRCPHEIKEGKLSDGCLIDSAKNGDENSFTTLVTRYKHRVFGLAAHFARDSFELDDICQIVFIKIYEHLGTFRHDAPFEHWLSRVTVNTCYDVLRKDKRAGRNVALESIPADIRDPAAFDARGPAQDAYEIMKRALTKLRPDERIIVTLLELEEQSVRDVAMLTGWSEGNVRIRAHRARQALKKILEGEA